MIELLEPSLHERAISIQIDCKEEIEIEADAGLFHRMLANILNNATRHLPSGSTVRVTLSRKDEIAWITVVDNGPGFPAEVSARLFEKHVKGQSSARHGLGLAFLHVVATAHGGTIERKSRRWRNAIDSWLSLLTAHCNEPASKKQTKTSQRGLRACAFSCGKKHIARVHRARALRLRVATFPWERCQNGWRKRR